MKYTGYKSLSIGNVVAAKRSTIQFPVPVQGSPLDFLFVQKQIQRGDDDIRSLAQLLGEVALADHNISGRELLVNGGRRIPFSKATTNVPAERMFATAPAIVLAVGYGRDRGRL